MYYTTFDRILKSRVSKSRRLQRLTGSLPVDPEHMLEHCPSMLPCSLPLRAPRCRQGDWRVVLLNVLNPCSIMIPISCRLRRNTMAAFFAPGVSESASAAIFYRQRRKEFVFSPIGGLSAFDSKVSLQPSPDGLQVDEAHQYRYLIVGASISEARHPKIGGHGMRCERVSEHAR